MLGFASQSWRSQSLGVLLSWLGVGALSRVWVAGLCRRWGFPGALQGWSSGGPQWRGLGQDVGLYPSLGCEMPVGLQWALRNLHGAQGTSLTGVGLGGPVQTWTNVRIPT